LTQELTSYTTMSTQTEEYDSAKVGDSISESEQRSKAEGDLKSRFSLPIPISTPATRRSPEPPSAKVQSRIPRFTSSPLQSPLTSPKLGAKSIALYPDSPLSTSPVPSPEEEKRDFPSKLPGSSKNGKKESPRSKPVLYRTNTYTKEMHEADEVEAEREKTPAAVLEKKPKGPYSHASTSFGFPTIPERREK
jgi:hypothetical protein